MNDSKHVSNSVANLIGDKIRRGRITKSSYSNVYNDFKVRL